MVKGQATALHVRQQGVDEAHANIEKKMPRDYPLPILILKSILSLNPPDCDQKLVEAGGRINRDSATYTRRRPATPTQHRRKVGVNFAKITQVKLVEVSLRTIQ